EAFAVCEGTLEREPRREASLVLAARLAGHLGYKESALNYWRRAITVNPWLSRYRLELARILAGQQRWSEVLQECQALVSRNGGNVEARLLLATALAGTGDLTRARTELATAIALDPKRGGEHRRRLAALL